MERTKQKKLSLALANLKELSRLSKIFSWIAGMSAGLAFSITFYLLGNENLIPTLGSDYRLHFLTLGIPLAVMVVVRFLVMPYGFLYYVNKIKGIRLSSSEWYSFKKIDGISG